MSWILPNVPWIDWPVPGLTPGDITPQPAFVWPPETIELKFTTPGRLSDEDVERIAKRVAQLLREESPR